MNCHECNDRAKVDGFNLCCKCLLSEQYDLKRQLAEAREVIRKQHEAYEYLMKDIKNRLDFGMSMEITRDEDGILFPWGHGVVIGLDNANEEAKQILKKGEKW